MNKQSIDVPSLDPSWNLARYVSWLDCWHICKIYFLNRDGGGVKYFKEFIFRVNMKYCPFNNSNLVIS